MKLIVDENVAERLVEELVARGHDVAWVSRRSPGLDDGDLFRLAMREGRIVLTHDRGHGERALVEPVPGVIVMRVTENRPLLEHRVLVDLLERRDDWLGNLAVIVGHRVRMRALPDVQSGGVR
ncbi:MAG TPA: DUF5615 family PIN-like protein [Actinomycetota bacterium]